jgi:toxin HigB-1
LRDILVRLDAASTATDMDLPGFRLHPLKGAFKGFWAVDGAGALASDPSFAGGDALDVDCIDYH